MTKITVAENRLIIEPKKGFTKISINTLYIERGMTLMDIIKMYNDSLTDLENRLEASISEEAILRLTEDTALAQYSMELSTQVNNNHSYILNELTSYSTELGSLATTVSEVSATADDITATLTAQTAVYAGYFTNSSLPVIGNIKNVSGVNYQYLGGSLGPNSDGWVIYNNTALGTANQVKGWLATASSLVVNPSTGQVTGWQYGDGSGFNSFFTISASKITVSGETTFISNIVGGINNGTTTINGGKITTDTITADQMNTNALAALTIYVDSNNNPRATTVNGGTLALVVSRNGQNFNALAGVNENSDGTGNGIQGNHSGSGVGVRGVSQNGVGVNGDTFNGAGEWGFYTAYKVSAASYTPFTGAHIAYTQESLSIGQVVYSIDAWTVNINQTLVHVAKTDTKKDKRVIGIVSYVKTTLLDNITKNIAVSDKFVDPSTGEEIWTIKPEYKPYVDYMEDNNFMEVSINSLGEGGILVSNLNGNIDNGDYLTSDGTGTTMKQDDDLLHSYTVAKALESVDWSKETSTTKMIACTYHCG